MTQLYQYLTVIHVLCHVILYLFNLHIFFVELGGNRKYELHFVLSTLTLLILETYTGIEIVNSIKCFHSKSQSLI